ncbi:MAG: glycoside hydrolase family 47 [Capsulimonas sp.]|nr:glycoside hydrolase family 47 [Capsulimonas sp.]
MKKVVIAAVLLMSALAVPSFAEGVKQDAPQKWTDARKCATAERVRQECLHAWNGYKKYAWGHDEVLPVSNQPRDWYGVSLLMTPVDALDTLHLMGLTKEADEARELIDTKLSFDQDVEVKAFEISIRLLGGLNSAYQLTGDPRLLALADDLGTRLLPIFESPTGLPYVNINLKTGKVSGVDSCPAEAGSYLFEFGTLSKLTGKKVYYEKAKRAVVAVYDRQSPLGLVGATMNIETGKWTSDTCQIGALVDAYYEYLLKCAILFGDKDCERMWRSSIASVNKYVADDTHGDLWYGQTNMNTGERQATYYGALDAYFPAVLALNKDLPRAKRLEDSCCKMWTLAGVEPEQLDYSTMQITSPGYVLRPEIIESAYYLYTDTKDPKYLDMGSMFLDSIVKYCRTDTAFTALDNVEKKKQGDDMESFFFAETLKYLYLLYAPKRTLDLGKVVFNSEAHPIRRYFSP